MHCDQESVSRVNKRKRCKAQTKINTNNMHICRQSSINRQIFKEPETSNKRNRSVVQIKLSFYANNSDINKIFHQHLECPLSSHPFVQKTKIMNVCIPKMSSLDIIATFYLGLNVQGRQIKPELWIISQSR